MRPLVSVVIPTYNRYKYLPDCIEATRSIDSEELEIVIQDNSTNNSEFLNYINNLNDKRVKYFYNPNHVSVGDNCDMGIDNATGDFICMLGDDDTVCSNILRAARYLKDNNIECCCSPIPGFYWPDMNSTYMGKRVPAFFLRYKATGEIRYIDTRDVVKKYACKGGMSDYMPRVYHELVSKDCLNRIKEKTGTYFPGPSPDMANGVAVCLESNSTVYLSDYLIISGYGGASSRGQSNRNEHYGNIQDMWWLPKDTRDKWDKNIPPYFSGETIFAQSAIQSLTAMSANKDEFKFDYSGLYTSFFWQHKRTRRLLLSFVLCSPKRLWWFFVGVANKVKGQLCHKKESVKNYFEKDDIRTLKQAKMLAEELSLDIKYRVI